MRPLSRSEYFGLGSPPPKWLIARSTDVILTTDSWGLWIVRKTHNPTPQAISYRRYAAARLKRLTSRNATDGGAETNVQFHGPQGRKTSRVAATGYSPGQAHVSTTNVSAAPGWQASSHRPSETRPICRHATEAETGRGLFRSRQRTARVVTRSLDRREVHDGFLGLMDRS